MWENVPVLPYLLPSFLPFLESSGLLNSSLTPWGLVKPLLSLVPSDSCFLYSTSVSDFFPLPSPPLYFLSANTLAKIPGNLYVPYRALMCC